MATATHGGSAGDSGDKLKGGWAYPGDLGAIDLGFLTLVGRTSDLIIRGGANVHPSEVESVIAEHEGVQNVAVVGFTKQPEGEEIAAFVVPSIDLTEAALIAHCRVRLPPDKRPRKSSSCRVCRATPMAKSFARSSAIGLKTTAEPNDLKGSA